MTEHDQKYLSEKMEIEYSRNYPYFETPHGFFAAFWWGKMQEWWDEFRKWLWKRWRDHLIKTDLDWVDYKESLVGPRFAEKLVGFLKSRG